MCMANDEGENIEENGDSNEEYSETKEANSDSGSSDSTTGDIQQMSSTNRMEQIISVYENSFQSYRTADRMIVYEMYLGVLAISILVTIMEQADLATDISLLTTLAGFFILSILYYSSWTLEQVKHVASNTMKDIERNHFEDDIPKWQVSLDNEVTHTAESGDSLGWFWFLSEDSLPNKIVPTGWVGIQIILILFWVIYSIRIGVFHGL